ncbi:Hypothetical transmembrane protein [Flavobacterium indicum GPTSA100-9 = DSM 17447]|uniref:Hypothetical transmembrane protein n=1 Tax=Flavobacterium indicum (strain DSM 17447 / CIP 109464 / GPTSA100-9) TaxID=1094466 RepID=H8XUG3_FLAIG|nr:hypothetical protein [Flavobacterium indicum]CCG52946.1 Hypothetical transmembrane protein [Flavobacterium indicum GPTSA100-9 = DSM 17447]
MKNRILFDNYYIYLIAFALSSVFKYLLTGKNNFVQFFIIVALLWLYESLSEKKKYLSNLKMDEEIIELEYFDSFLKERKIRIDKQNITSINYIKNTRLWNKFDCLQIIEKENSKDINFKIFDKKMQESVQKIIT